MRIPTTFTILGFLTAALLSVGAPAQGGPGGPGGPGQGNQALIAYLQSLPIETVDVNERFLLRHMREEEKLARDVYHVLGQYWQMQVFANITQAEQSHMDLVEFALLRYQIPDPVVSNQIGVFTDPQFTSLFQLATNFGQTSPLHALLVGAIIEDLDIHDLDTALFFTDNRDVDTIWQNLQRGSRNHMRAFYPQLVNLGLTYTGLFLTPAEIQAIVTTPMETAPVDENGVPLP